jgi:hypothetical protein
MKRAKTILNQVWHLFILVLFTSLTFSLYAQEIKPLNTSGNVTDYRSQVGQTFRFRVTGSDAGSVWGGADGIYTDDSNLDKAAVHAGILRVGQQGIVTVTMLEGQPAYTASTQNGVTSTSYGAWQGSFKFGKGTLIDTPVIPPTTEDNIAATAPANMAEYRGQVGQVFKFRVTGSSEGSVWGGADGIYTDDSNLAKAAVHAGILSVGQQGIVTVTILAGQPAYTASTQNGVTSTSYGAWQGSFKFGKVIITDTPITETFVPNAPANMTEYRGQIGQTFRFRIIGSDAGSVWGGADGIYTDDSNLAKAAVHAGILRVGQQGIVTVTMLAGQSAYTGNIQNGITSTSYGAWQWSYKLK